MTRVRIRQVFGLAALAASFGIAMAQPVKAPAQPVPPSFVSIEEPNAQHTKEELSRLLEKYPPTLRNVLAIDPSLLGNQAFLAPYPALANFLNAHPEIQRSPSFYIGENYDRRFNHEQTTSSERIWERLEGDLSIMAGFAMAIGVVTWLIRTIIDYRRWNRLSKVQTDVHTKLLDRFTANDELLAYIQSPAGAKFLESSPITLDPGPRSISAPLGRILFSVQAGLVSMTVGIGLQAVAGRLRSDASLPFHALGVIGVALGLGFMLSAIVSFMISYRLGLIEPPQSPTK